MARDNNRGLHASSPLGDEAKCLDQQFDVALSKTARQNMSDPKLGYGMLDATTAVTGEQDYAAIPTGSGPGGTGNDGGVDISGKFGSIAPYEFPEFGSFPNHPTRFASSVPD